MTVREVPRVDLAPTTCVPVSSPRMMRHAVRMAKRREQLRRVGNYVRNERVALGFETLTAWADHVGISERTLGKLERGEGAGGNTVASVENHLYWEPGSIEDIARGGEPTRLPREEPAPPQPRYPDDPERQEIWDAVRGVDDAVREQMVETVMSARGKFTRPSHRETGT